MTREDVEQLAALSRIALTDNEKDDLANSMTDILGFVSDVQGITSVEKEKKATGLFNVMREDVPSHVEGAYTEAILGSAPRRKGQYIHVKKILGGTE